MVAMAEAAGISTAEAIIVGGFTDFVDTVRARRPPPTTAGQRASRPSRTTARPS
jgi:hypothetical protein